MGENGRIQILLLAVPLSSIQLDVDIAGGPGRGPVACVCRHCVAYHG